MGLAPEPPAGLAAGIGPGPPDVQGGPGLAGYRVKVSGLPLAG